MSGNSDITIGQRATEIAKSDDFIARKDKHRKYLTHVKLLDEVHFERRMRELALDMAEREGDRCVEMMQYERAGLSPREQKKIPKLDVTNNECYKYLRDHSNSWQYDPAKVDNKVKCRLYRRFDTFDKGSDGMMSIDDVLHWANRMWAVCDTNKKEVDNVRKQLEIYFTMYGLGAHGGGLHRENWVEAHTTMGKASEERKKQGDPVPMETLADTYFDVLDENNDKKITMDELKKMMRVFHVPEEAAFPFFEKADADWNGELSRTEMHQVFYEFWFGEYDVELDGIFAHKY